MNKEVVKIRASTRNVHKLLCRAAKVQAFVIGKAKRAHRSLHFTLHERWRICLWTPLVLNNLLTELYPNQIVFPYFYYYVTILQFKRGENLTDQFSIFQERKYEF